MISTGAGMAKAGFIPIVDTFGQFGVTKGNLPLTMAALSQAPVIAISRMSDFRMQQMVRLIRRQPISLPRVLFHTAVIAPSCADEEKRYV